MRDLSEYRVLIAEDNVVNQKLLSRMVERRGATVDMAGSGVDAIRLVQKSAYDLILMDCHMPEMDGLEATRNIRAFFGTRTPPIIAVTASSTEDDRRACFEAGMDDCVLKPLNIPSVNAVLDKWISPRKAARAAVVDAPTLESRF